METRFGVTLLFEEEAMFGFMNFSSEWGRIFILIIRPNKHDSAHQSSMVRSGSALDH